MRAILRKGILVAFFISRSFSGGVHLSGGHNHHEGHGHTHFEEEERPTISLTLFQKDSELFLEFPALVRNKESKFLAHLTHLPNSKPFLKGRVIVILSSSGQPDEIFRADSMASDGIFMPIVTPRISERRKVTLFVQSGHGTGTFSLGEHQVYANVSEIPTGEEHENSQNISFLKEQQWKTEFGIQKIQSQAIPQSIQAPARIAVPDNALSQVKSPLEGQLLEVLVDLYQWVEKGQPVARIRPSDEFINYYDEQKTNLEKLGIDLEFQESEVKRFSKLVKHQSASQKELISTRLQVARLTTEISAVQRKITVLENSYHLEEQGGILILILHAQDRGLIQSIHEASGVRLEKFEEILSILNTDELVMEVYFPLRSQSFKPLDLSYRQIGSEDWRSGKGKLQLEKGRWLQFTDTSQKYRSYSIPLLDGSGFQPQQFLEVEAFGTVGDAVLTIPREALSVEQGNTYVYVQADGESFERRRVHIGKRMASEIVVTSGLTPGEWVVVKGVYNLRLAGSTSQVPDHGHAH